jgi:isocitrate dehydrogenase kinase/phosphatase
MMIHAAFPKLLSSQIAFDIARTILDGFDKHYRLFREASQAARAYFEASNWKTVRALRSTTSASMNAYGSWKTNMRKRT